MIGGIDYTDIGLNLPLIDDNLPDWGQTDLIFNDILEIDFPLEYLPNFNVIDPYSKAVLYTIDDVIYFNGEISNFVYDNYKVTVKCKASTYVLFNRHIRENEIMSPYVVDNENPAVILREMLELIGLDMNTANYNAQRNFFDDLGVTLSVTNENWATVDLINKLAEVTCSRIYFYNNEFYYETYNRDAVYPYIEIRDRDWVDYPNIETVDKYPTEYRGTEVKFGANEAYFILKNERIPEKTIDLSIDYVNGIYTDSAVTAQFIADAYDALLSAKRLYLTGSLKLGIMEAINKRSYILWDDRIYAFRNIKNAYETHKPVECVSLDYMSL